MTTEAAPKVWTKQEIADKIKTDDRWALRAIVAIFEKQTADEQTVGYTKHSNGVGYNAFHADFMTSIAKSAIKSRQSTGKYSLSPKQLKAGRKIILHYTRQLAEIANEAVTATA